MFCSYKPVKLSALIEPLKLDFEALVRETFSNLDNKKFLENVEVSIVCQQVLLCGYLLVKQYFMLQGKVSIFGVLGDFVETLQKSIGIFLEKTASLLCCLLTVCISFSAYHGEQCEH